MTKHAVFFPLPQHGPFVPHGPCRWCCTWQWLRMRLKRRTLDAMFDIGYQVITTRLVKLRRLKEVTKVRACAEARG